MHAKVTKEQTNPTNVRDLPISELVNKPAKHGYKCRRPNHKTHLKNVFSTMCLTMLQGRLLTYSVKVV